MFEEQVSTIRQSIASISPLMVNLRKGEAVSKISQCLSDFEKKPTTVLVCGEFKRGKSTFINALIGRSVCPTDVDICTSVVSVIKYGVNEKAIRYFGDFSNLKKEVISIDDIEQYTVGSAEEIDNTICVELELPLEELKKGLILIDTPGVGGLDPRHAMLTNYFLPQADVTLFMTDVNEPLTTTELDFYKNKVLPYAKYSAVIVNKADLKDEKSVEEIRQDTINKLSVYLQEDAALLKVISVSAADCIREEEGLGNLGKVRLLIDQLVEEHKRESLTIIRDDLSEQLDLAIAPLKAQITQIESPDTNQIQVLNNKKLELTQKLNDLSNPQSGFRLAINDKIDSERQAILMHLNKLCIELSSTEFNQWLQDPQATSNGKWIGQKLYDRIDELSSEIILKQDKAFESVAQMKEFEGLLSFTRKKYQGQLVVKDVDLSVPTHKRILAGMSGYGIAAAGLFLLSGFATIAALATAAYVSTRQIKEVGTGMQQAELRRVYLPQLQTETQNIRIFVEGRFTEFHRELLQTLSGKIKEYQDSVNMSINEIQKIKQQINVAVNQKVALQKQLNVLETAKKSLDTISI